jgi:hypothetical protein
MSGAPGGALLPPPPPPPAQQHEEVSAAAAAAPSEEAGFTRAPVLSVPFPSPRSHASHARRSPVRSKGSRTAAVWVPTRAATSAKAPKESAEPARCTPTLDRKELKDHRPVPPVAAVRK